MHAAVQRAPGLHLLSPNYIHHPVTQVLQRIINSNVGWGKLAIARDTEKGEGTAQPAATTNVSMKLSPQSSPHHYMVEVSVGRLVLNMCIGVVRVHICKSQ